MFIGILFLLSIVIGLADLFLMLQISGGIGIYVIIFSQTVSGLFGWYMLKKMDFNLFFFIEAELKKGQTIVKELWDEAFVLTAVCFLVAPGFFTDIIGCLFLIRQVRSFFMAWFE